MTLFRKQKKSSEFSFRHISFDGADSNLDEYFFDILNDRISLEMRNRIHFGLMVSRKQLGLEKDFSPIEKNTSVSRYPSEEFIMDFAREAVSDGYKIDLHFCGMIANSFLDMYDFSRLQNFFVSSDWRYFFQLGRVNGIQLNIDSDILPDFEKTEDEERNQIAEQYYIERTKFLTRSMFEFRNNFGVSNFILQAHDKKSRKFAVRTAMHCEMEASQSSSPFRIHVSLDASRGTGLVPENFNVATSYGKPGYAGGITPANADEIFEKVLMHTPLQFKPFVNLESGCRLQTHDNRFSASAIANVFQKAIAASKNTRLKRTQQGYFEIDSKSEIEPKRNRP